MLVTHKTYHGLVKLDQDGLAVHMRAPRVGSQREHLLRGRRLRQPQGHPQEGLLGETPVVMRSSSTRRAHGGLFFAGFPFCVATAWSAYNNTILLPLQNLVFSWRWRWEDAIPNLNREHTILAPRDAATIIMSLLLVAGY
jgi:hypothetical protein